jgi:hypothetical protein
MFTLTGPQSALVALRLTSQISDAGYQHLHQGILLRNIAADFTLDEHLLHSAVFQRRRMGMTASLSGIGHVSLDLGKRFSVQSLPAEFRFTPP